MDAEEGSGESMGSTVPSDSDTENTADDIIWLEEVFLFNHVRARPQLIHERRIFLFNKHRVRRSDGMRVEDYRCRECRGMSLVVSAHQPGSSQRALLHEQGMHLCQENAHVLRMLEARQAMVSMARNVEFGVPRPTLRAIYNSVRDQLPPVVRAQFGSFSDGTNRMLQRVRQAAFPRLPADLASFDTIPAELIRLPATGELFVLFFVDYPEYDGNVGTLLAFGTLESCVKLSQAQRIFCDATFKIVPHPFYQCFSISTMFGLQHNMILCPRVFVLCSHKTEITYNRLFDNLFDKFVAFGIPIDSVRWRQATVDFESAERNAIKQVSRNHLRGKRREILFVSIVFSLCELYLL